MATEIRCDTCGSRFPLKEVMLGSAVEYAKGRYLCPTCKDIAEEAQVEVSNQKYSNLLVRGLAFLIDVIPITVIVFLLTFQFTDFGEVWNAYMTQGVIDSHTRIEYTEWKNLIRFMSGVAYICYATLLESSAWRSTVGKRLVGIRVVDTDFKQLTMKAALKRNTSKVLSAIPLMIGFLSALFNEKQRAWHDKIAGSYVIEKNSNTQSCNGTP